MQKKRIRLIGAVAAVSVCVLLVFAGSGFSQEFSADCIASSGGARTEGKISVTKEKVRIDMGEAVTITRLDKDLVWMLMPQQKMYMQMPLKSNSVVVGKEAAPGEIERELVGREPIDGRITEKYRVVYDVGGTRQTVYTWISKDVGLPLKTASGDGSWAMEFKKIKLGKQAETLFEVPQEYKMFSIGMPVGGMRDLYDSESKN